MAQVAKHRRETVERNIAARVKAERQAREWSLETMSKKLEAAGFPVAVSSLHRLEREDPPPRISVDQALAFCDVFELAFEDLTRAEVSPEAADMALGLTNYLATVEGLTSARREVLRAEEALLESARPHSKKDIEEAVQIWQRRSWIDGDVAGEFVDFLTGRAQASPFAGAIGGRATLPPGTPNLLDEDTGR
jgi:transcriptional regulator with XRE-family HTH domain